MEKAGQPAAAAGEAIIDDRRYLGQGRAVKRIITVLQVSVLAIGLAFVLTGCSDEEPSPMKEEPPPNPDNPDIPPEPGKK
jgi:hypothetical protein